VRSKAPTEVGVDEAERSRKRCVANVRRPASFVGLGGCRRVLPGQGKKKKKKKRMRRKSGRGGGKNVVEAKPGKETGTRRDDDPL